ncbi:MAG: trypsin-like peptidase domain-containing protein [Elusimicrobiales bacterium]|nr:trypsin-like peptidase domain-containing protein [Elusimicrobiales bacterium]
MNKIFTALFAALIISPAFAFAAPNRIIYGNDDRLDYSQASSSMQKLADSVVSFWDKDYIKDINGSQHLLTVSYEKGVGLCPGERFGTQPIGAFCSGTLVGEDLVLTAGHCITDEDSCAKARMVFGFNDKMLKNGKPVNENITVYPVDNSEVYSCAKIVKRHLGKQHSGTAGMIWDYILANYDIIGADYALIKLDRKVSNHKPLDVERSAKPQKGDKIFVIGHPVGLPVKIAGGAQIRNTKPWNFFLTDLDTFGGNSGSAVFSEATGKIIGILVRGGTDFVDSDKGCKVQNKVDQDFGKGEAVNRLDKVLSSIPDISGKKGNNSKSAAKGEVTPVSPDMSKVKKPDVKIVSPF